MSRVLTDCSNAKKSKLETVGVQDVEEEIPVHSSPMKPVHSSPKKAVHNKTTVDVIENLSIPKAVTGHVFQFSGSSGVTHDLSKEPFEDYRSA